jgi:Transcriptional regulators
MNLKINGKGPENGPDRKDYREAPMILVNEVSHLMWENIRRQGLEHPVSQKSGQMIMMELAKRDGRTQLDLANATHLKAPTISVSLQKLEKEGYVRRQPDEYDLRATRVFLTDKGREIDEHIRRVIREEENRASAGMTAEESETLIRLLLKLKANLVGADEEGSGQ